MSEQPERAAPASRAGGGGGNVFTDKIGPLPMWAWVAIAAAILVAWRYFAGKNASASSQQSTASTPADQVPQFVNQTYTTVTAPLAPTGKSTGSGTTAPVQPSPSSPTPAGWPGPTTSAPPSPWAPMQTTRPAATIGSVTGLRSTGAGATNVTLAWNPVSGAQRYQVRVTYQDKIVKTAFTNGTSYNVAGLSPNRTYGLHVVAINGNDWAPEASIVQKTT